MWKQGSIGIPNGKGGFVSIRYCAKVYDEPSNFGINEGRIIKLELRQNGRIVYNYDRGLDMIVRRKKLNLHLQFCLKNTNKIENN